MFRKEHKSSRMSISQVKSVIQSNGTLLQKEGKQYEVSFQKKLLFYIWKVFIVLHVYFGCAFRDFLFLS
jgi:hypothetical protein